MIAEKIAEPLVSVEGFIRSVALDRASIGTNRTDTLALVESLYGESCSKDTVREMAALLECIRKNRGATVEELGAMTGIEYGKTSSLTAMMELDGFISIDLLQRCCIISGKMR
jgi:hypothetical protein